MKIEYNVTGLERKTLVGAISDIINKPQRYLGAPSFAYEVGGYNIDKTGTVIGPDNRDLVADLQCLHSIVPVSEEYDVPLPEEPETSAFESLQLTEREELGLGRERRDHWGEDGMQPSDVPGYWDDDDDGDQHHPEQYADQMMPVTEAMMSRVEEELPPECPDSEDDIITIEIPLAGFMDATIDNLKKLIESKAALIKKAIGSNLADGAGGLPVLNTGERLQFPWFRFGIAPDEAGAYSSFISALCALAKKQKRVTATAREVENEKFSFRVFLIRLGFVGNAYKAARKVLLKNLDGNSAFRQPPDRLVGDNTHTDDSGDDNADIDALVDRISTEAYTPPENIGALNDPGPDAFDYEGGYKRAV